MVTIRFAALALLLVLGMAYNAHALDLTPAGATWFGNTPGNPDTNDVESISGCGCQLNAAYKIDEPSTESGSFAGSYSTTFSNTLSDPSNATITYVSGTAISGDPIYLLVKDGNHDPKWYLFDITGWNGTDTINLSGFWPAQGAISHVTIFSAGTATVPEPSSLLLLGSALLVLGLAARRRFRK